MDRNPSKARNFKVAAIIPVYNGADRVASAIQSALSQSFRPDEIVVVDDGSTDNTADVAQRYPIKLVRQQNAGPGGARNAGVRVSQSEWLAFLDHDDTWRKDKTEKQLEFASNPQIGVIYSCSKPKDEVQFCWQTLWERNIVGTPSGVMIRRECFFETGGFDTRRCLVGTEDHHLWMRIAQTKWLFARCPGRLYDYTPAGNSLSRHFARMADAETISYTEIAQLAGLDEGALSRKLTAVNNHYIREFIGVRDLTSARRLIKAAGLRRVPAELLLAAFSPAWAFEIRRCLRNRLSHENALA